MSAPDPLTVGLAVLERFQRYNEALKAQGDRLREAIRVIDGQHVGPVLIRAEAVRALLDLAALGRTKRPSLRTVQRHLEKIRASHVGVSRADETS